MSEKSSNCLPRFPVHRLRRLRASKLLRQVTRDVTLEPSNIILPLFVGDLSKPRAIASMPDVYQWPVEDAVKKIGELVEKGLKSFILFGVTDQDKKDSTGSFAASVDAPVNQVLTKVREQNIEALLIADLCFCEYTDHGHCGVLKPGADSASSPGSGLVVDNDATLVNLGKTAVAQAKAGADIIAPSGMMDGQVKAIRSALDGAGYDHTAILSYSIKYASSFYGPFRDAGGGHMLFGDRSGYQMDYRRKREWQLELQSDLAQGADMVMVKPAMAYLDVLSAVRQSCNVPVAAYHVSGEYAMLCAAAEKGLLELTPAALEATYAMRRAGADLIITYFAAQLLEWLENN